MKKLMVSSFVAWACMSISSMSWLAAAEALDRQNLIVNGGFELDQDNLRAERMSCPVRPRVTYGQSDAIPDVWNYDPQQQARVREGHGGQFAGILVPAGKHKLTQSFTYAVQTKSDGPLPPLHFAGWVKSSKGGKDAVSAEIVLQIVVKDEKTGQGQVTPIHTVKKDFPATTAWSQMSFDISSAELATALNGKPQPVGLILAAVSLQTPADSGQVFIDDVELSLSRAPAAYTLVANAGFEAADAPGQPAQWSKPKKSLRYFGSNYYIWRDWFHFFSEPRGVVRIDSQVVRSGKSALRLNVPPGDDKHVESGVIALNQTEPRRMVVRFDYNSYLLANMLVQIVDEQGVEVFAQNIAPGTSEGWRTFETEFLPRKAQLKPVDIRVGSDLFGATGDARALKGCRVRIGVKGVNGSEMDDINQWVNVNHAGVLWIDNVVLAETQSTAQELTARGATVHKLADPAPALVAESIDLGERLFGENVAAVRIVNRGAAPAAGTLTMTITGPYREYNPRKAGYAVGAVDQYQQEPRPKKLDPQVVTARYEVGPNASKVVMLPYEIRDLLTDWRSEYRASLSLGGREATEIPFGTWSQPALVEVERCYAFEEHANQIVFMNLGVTQSTLGKISRLKLEVRRARDDRVALTTEVPNVKQTAERGNAVPLSPGFEGDSTNFVVADFQLSGLPVHPQDRPVRDHYVQLIAEDAAGKAIFTSRSPRFGRMQPHSEKLDAITSVALSPNNYILINGKPLYARGHIWMQQNFGPSPLARDNTDWKKYGFNTKAGTQSPLVEKNSADPRYAAGVDDLWSMHNTYLNSQMIAPTPPLTDAVRADIQKWTAKPNVIGIHFVPWEGEPSGDPAQAVEYAKQIKAAIGGRPLWVSAGWFAPRVNGRIDPAIALHDWYAPENNAYFQPSQLDKEVLAQRAGQPCVLSTYPNVFNDTPWLVQRFEHWTEIIRHHTGYLQIGKPGDPTLMAGQNGELRFIESFLFSPDKAPSVAAAPNVEHLVRATPKANYILATNAGPTIGGDWLWSTKLKDQGRAAHTGTALWSRFHPYMQDYYSHFYKDDRPVRVKKGDTIVQYVYLPAASKAENIILMARGNGEWRYHATWGDFNHGQFTDSGVRMWMAKDMHQMSWGSLAIGFCGPEGHDPKNPKLLQYTFTADQFHRLGNLPATGAWVRLEVPVDQLGLDGKVVDGFAFISKGAKVLWERTLLVQDGHEIALCDGSAGIPPEDLEKVRFNVEGLKAGTKVNVCFEEREIVAKDGYFEDDLSGEPGYRNMWVSLYGDKLGETGYYGNGINYNYNWGKVAARLYEVPK